MVFGTACVMQMGSLALAQAGAACQPGGTVAEVNACAVQDFQAADTTIQILYEDVMRALSAHERPQLRQEHSAWCASAPCNASAKRKPPKPSPKARACTTSA